MNDVRTLGLLDRNGRPLPAHVERALMRLLPRLRRQFPALKDEIAVTDVLEEAGHRIAARERNHGSIEKLHGYAWVALRSVATSHLRLGSSQLIQKTLESGAGATRIASTPAERGSVSAIERDILLREVLDRLSPDEKRVCLWKRAGFSSQEIADFQGRTVAAVDKLLSRARQKIRDAIGLTPKRPRGDHD